MIDAVVFSVAELPPDTRRVVIDAVAEVDYDRRPFAVEVLWFKDQVGQSDASAIVAALERVGVTPHYSEDVDALTFVFCAGGFGPNSSENVRLEMYFHEGALVQMRLLSEAYLVPKDLQIDDDVEVLYRPTGPEEISLVERADFKAWPPRLPDQPIFYPVTNEEYAAQIAREWNVPASGYGCVTRFRVRKSFMARFPIRQVGAAQHREWWVPAEELTELNANIVGRIEIVREYGKRPPSNPSA